MPRPFARIGDIGDHGGEITTGSDVHEWDDIPAARVGDIYECALHGPNPLATGSDVVEIDGRKAVRVGDFATCGARIITGSPVNEEV